MKISLAADFTSAFGIGQNVLFNTGGNSYNNAWVRCVIFTRGKVRYSLWVQIDNDIDCVHNIDSAFVEAGPGPDRVFDFDNYS